MNEFLTRLEYLRYVQLRCGYQKAWVYHKLKAEFDLGQSELQAIGKALGFKPAWSKHKWQQKWQELQDRWLGESLYQQEHLPESRVGGVK